MRTEETSDLELLRRWQAGDGIAGNRLCRRYTDKLHRFFATKVPPREIPDLTQQTWLAMAQANRRGTQGEVTVRCFRAYLFGIARRMVLGHYAGRGHAKGIEFDPEIQSLMSLEPSISRQLSLQRQVQRIELALQSLPVELQLLFEGHYVEQLAGPELAEIFGIPEGTVRSRLMRARRLLNEALDRLKAGQPSA